MMHRIRHFSNQARIFFERCPDYNNIGPGGSCCFCLFGCTEPPAGKQGNADILFYLADH